MNSGRWRIILILRRQHIKDFLLTIQFQLTIRTGVKRGAVIKARDVYSVCQNKRDKKQQYKYNFSHIKTLTNRTDYTFINIKAAKLDATLKKNQHNHQLFLTKTYFCKTIFTRTKTTKINNNKNDLFSESEEKIEKKQIRKQRVGKNKKECHEESGIFEKRFEDSHCSTGKKDKRVGDNAGGKMDKRERLRGSI